METPATTTTATAEIEPKLGISRWFDAPRATVFRAFTAAEHMRHWWGPTHHPAIHTEIDARVGGKWRACLKGVEDGRELWHGGVFREVDPPERLVFTFAWDEEGERGLETVVTIVFTEHKGRTHMDFSQSPFVSDGEREGHSEGWNSTFDRLAAYIAVA